MPDVTGQLTSSTPNYTALCDDSNSNLPNCSDYSYFILENTSFSSSSSYYVMFDFYPLSNGVRLPYNASSYYSLDSVTALWFRNPSSFGSNTFSYTLTNSLGSIPSGSLSITENGTYDVTDYATAVVDVPPEVVQGDYHQDLVNLNQGIYVCGAILLVIYFFYCIYRMIIRTTGGV